MDFNIKPNKLTRQDGGMPQTIEQLVKKYKLDSMWEEIQKIVEEVLQHAEFISAGTLSGDRIKGGTLKLGGENDTNGSIQVVDANGKNIVSISKEGLVLYNGTRLIGNGGVLSNLQFTASGLSEINGDTKSAGEYYMLGFIPDYPASSDKYNLFIDVYIPDNFKIEKAFITLRHIPYLVHMDDNEDIYGYVRNVKCYLANMDGDAYVEGMRQSEYLPQLDGISYGEISGCFNNSNNSFTANVPSEENLEITQTISQDIGSKLKNHCRIKIATTNSIPNEESECFAQTGWVYAQLNVFGYIK